MVRPTPSALAICAMVMSPRSLHGQRRRSLLRGEFHRTAAEPAGGLGDLPADLGALSDELTLVMPGAECRSNSARAPKMWNCNRPAEVVVSICSVSERKPISRSWRFSIGFDQVFEAAAEAVQAPDHERVAGSEELKAGVELGAMAQRPGADIAEYASAAGLPERVELQGEVLIVGGDARVADQMAAGRAAPARGAAARSGGRG